MTRTCATGSNQVGQFQCGDKGFFLPGPENPDCKLDGARLVAVFTEDPGKFLDRCRVDQIGGRHPGVPHPHVQGTFALEGETPFRRIELM